MDMKTWYQLLLVAVLACTVSGQCNCIQPEEDPAKYNELNVYKTHTLDCTSIPEGSTFTCTWSFPEVSGAVLAIEFLNTFFKQGDKAELSKDSIVLEEFTSTKTIPLKSVDGNTLSIEFTLNAGEGATFEIGYLAVDSSNDDCVTKHGTTTTLGNNEDLVITSQNFPNQYDNNVECTFTVVPESGGSLELFVEYMKTEDDADFVELELTDIPTQSESGSKFHQKAYPDLKSAKITFDSDESVTESGFLMRFTQTPSPLCDGYCDAGDCDASSGSPVCNCPDGLSGDRCEDTDVCFEKCQAEETCSTCPVCKASCNKQLRKTNKKICKVCCLGKSGKCKKRGKAKAKKNNCVQYACISP